LKCAKSFHGPNCPECGNTYDLSNCAKNHELIQYLRLSKDSTIQTQSSETPNACLMNRVKTNEMKANCDNNSNPNNNKSKDSSKCDEMLCEICENEPCNYYCSECPKLKSLCESCFTIRHKKADMSAHVPEPWNKSVAGSFKCEQHGEDCTIYCKQDRVAVCHSCCLVGPHKGHEVSMISDESEACRQKIRDGLRSLDVSSNRLQALNQRVDSIFEELNGYSLMSGDKMGADGKGMKGPLGKLTDEITRDIDALIALLMQRKSELISECRRLCEQKSTELREQMDSICLQVASNCSTCHRLRQQLHEESSAWLLNNMDDMMNQVNKQLEKDSIVSRKQVVASAHIEYQKVCVESLLPVLGRVVCNDMLDVTKCVLYDGDESEGTIVTDGNYTKHCYVDDEFRFTLVTYDHLNNRMRKGGYVDVIRMSMMQVDNGGSNESKSDEQVVDGISFKVDMRVVDNGDGTYNVSSCRSRLQVGEYRMNVYIDDMTLTCGPVKIIISPPRPPQYMTFGTEGSDNSMFNYPRGIYATSNCLYVCDADNDRIQCFTMDGVYIRQFGSEGSGYGQFNGPTGICAADNRLYVCDNDNNRIQCFTMDGVYIRQFGSYGSGNGQFNYPTGICAANNCLYVFDASNDRIQCFTMDGVYIRQFGSEGSGYGQFNGPIGICATDNRLYGCDTSNHRICCSNL
jgi:hypothetical protein